MSTETTVLIDINDIRTYLLDQTNAVFEKLQLPLLTLKEATDISREYVKEKLQYQTVPGKFIYGEEHLADYVKKTYPVFNLEVKIRGSKDPELFTLYDIWEDHVVAQLEDSMAVHFLEKLPIPKYNYLSFEAAGSQLLIFIGEDIRHVLFNLTVKEKGIRSAVESISEQYSNSLLSDSLPKKPVNVDLAELKTVISPLALHNEIVNQQKDTVRPTAVSLKGTYESPSLQDIMDNVVLLHNPYLMHARHRH